MENILDVLKAMKKATARDIAARMKIEPAAALEMLREHEDRFEVAQANGYWWFTQAGDVPAKPEKGQKAAPPVRITPFELKGMLVEKGPMSADQLAKITGATAKGVATMLTNLVTKGEVSREKVGNKFVYSVSAAPVDAAPADCVSETAALPGSPVPEVCGQATDAVVKPVEPEVVLALLKKYGPLTTGELTNEYGRKLNRNFHGMFTAMDVLAARGLVSKVKNGDLVTWSLPTASQLADDERETAAKTTAEIVQDIPVFTARADDLVIPSSRYISQEIRRTKAKLSSLQKLQGVVRELRRHKNLLVGLRDA